MERLTATKFIEALKDGRAQGIENCTVVGEVNVRGQRFGNPLRIQHVTFEGDVDFSDVTIDGELNLKGCTFTKTLALSRAEIVGNLVLDDIILTDDIPFIRRQILLPAPLDLQGVIVRGDLRLVRAEIESDATSSENEMIARLSGATIGGSMLLDGVQCNLPINMSGTTISGDLLIGVDPLGRLAVFDNQVEASNLQVDGNITFTGTRISGGVSLTNCKIGGNISAFIHQSATSLSGRTTEMSCYFGDDFDLSFSDISGYVHLVGITIAGALKLVASEIGTLSCVPCVLHNGQNFGLTLCHFNSIIAPHATVKTWTDFSMVDVTGPNATGLAIDFRDFQTGGDLRFFSPKAFDAQLHARRSVPARDIPVSLKEGANVVGDISLARASIGGSLVMTNLYVEGAISMGRAKVDGEVHFRTLDSTLADPMSAESMANREPHPFRGASAHRLDIASAVFRSDVDLTGLRVTDPLLSADAAQPDKSPPVNGVVFARSVEVKGEMRLFRRNPSGKDTFAWIDHSIDLSNASIDRLILSAYSFDEDSAGEDDVALVGINLANATVRELEIPAIRVEGPDCPRSVFPVPIDLGDSSISIWNIQDDSLPIKDRFAAFLKQDKRFRRSTYLAIESYFRNRGHDEDANAIYCEMSELAYRQTRRDIEKSRWYSPSYLYYLLWKTPWHFAFRQLLGFGTAPMRLVPIILALWLVSLPIYYNVSNFEPTTVVRLLRSSTTTPDRVNAGPDQTTWGWGDAVAVSLRYHVPLSGILTRSAWELRDDAATCWGANWINLVKPGSPAVSGKSCSGVAVKLFAPEDWGILMSILNLIMWPFLLTFGIRKLLRQN